MHHGIYEIPPFGQSVHPFSDQNGAKTLADRTAHTYIAYIRESPPPPGPATVVIFDIVWLLRCRWKNVTQSFEEF